jgi:hypothetical protein
LQNVPYETVGPNPDVSQSNLLLFLNGLTPTPSTIKPLFLFVFMDLASKS